MEKIGAAVWATGRAGRVIVEAGLTRPWLEFRGGIVYSAAKDGLDLGEACGLDVRLGAPVSTDIDAVLARPDIDIVFYAGLGTPTEVAEACLRANRAGKDAITIAGLVHPKTILGPAAAADLDAAARAAGRRILGTGLWDYLTITLPLASMSNVLTFDEIRLERVADLTYWGHGILRDEGIGLDEVLLLTPGTEGTTVATAASQAEIRHLLEGGLPLAEIVIPRTRPPHASQLPMFGEQ